MAADNELSGMHKAFCEEYVANNYNATQAYMKVYGGNNPETAGTMASRILKKDKIKAYIKELQRERFEALNISAERVAEKLSDIAFSAKDDAYYNSSAQLKALDLLQKQLGLQTQKIDANVETAIKLNIEE